MPQPTSLLSIDSPIDSVIKIKACMVEDFFRKPNRTEYLKMLQISIMVMIHSFLNYFTKIRKNRNCPLIVKCRAFLKDRGYPC